jgi:putative ABC transport system permease protein
MMVPASLAIALRALRRHPLQTALTVLGMTMGVAAVLAMMAIGGGARSAIDDQIRAAGMNLIVVTAGNYKVKTTDDYGGGAVEPSASLFRFFEPVLLAHPEDDPMEKHNHPTARHRLGDSEAGLGSAATLTLADADSIRNLRGVQYVAEGIHQNVHVAAGAKRWFTRLHGADQRLPLLRRAWVLRDGRFFSAREQSRADQVVVLGSFAATRLFGDQNPIGQDVVIWKQSFRVVGTVTTTSWMIAPAAGDEQFDAVYIPFTTMHRLLNLTKLNDIMITSTSAGEVTSIMNQVTSLLRARHHIAENAPDDFTVTTQARQAIARGGLRPEVARAMVGNVSGLEKVTLEQLGRTLDRAAGTMALLLAAVAAVSLVVGGIGIMNIMLVAVTDRTREIGLRRAVGARARDVRSQFVLEALVLSVASAVIGITLGVSVAAALSRYFRWTAEISVESIVLSVGVAAAVGLFFGWYPASRAAALHPVQALRRE